MNQMEKAAIEEARARGEDVSGNAAAEAVEDALDSSPLSRKGRPASASSRPASAAAQRPTSAAASRPASAMSRSSAVGSVTGDADSKLADADGPLYPKVESYFGTVHRAKIVDAPKPPPLLPTFAVPSRHVAQRLLGAFGMEVEHTTSAVPAKSPPRGGLPKARTASARSGLVGALSASDLNLDEAGSDDEDGEPLYSGSVEDIPREVQEDLWYTFDSRRPEFIEAKARFVALAEQEARSRGWEHVKDAGSSSRPSSAAPSAGSSGAGRGRGVSSAGSRRRVLVRTITVPEKDWARSRTRLDVLPVAVWTAHTDALTSMSLVHDPHALMTTSLDGSTRMWTFNGLPMAVVNAPPRNIALELALAAAAAVSGHSDLAPKTVSNLTKEDAQWQFVPDDETKVKRQTQFAESVISRLTKLKSYGPQRRMSIMLAAPAPAPAEASVKSIEQAAKSANASAALSAASQMGRRNSKADAESQVAQNAFVLAAQASTAAAEAVVIKHHNEEQLKLQQQREQLLSSEPAGLTRDQQIENDERATAALDKAIISAIENWEAHTDMRRSSQQALLGAGSSAKAQVVLPLLKSAGDPAGGEAHPAHVHGARGRRMSEEQTMRMYPHLARESATLEFKRKALEEEFIASIDAAHPVAPETEAGRSGKARPSSAASMRSRVAGARHGSAAPGAASAMLLRSQGADEEFESAVRSAHDFSVTAEASAAARPQSASAVRHVQPAVGARPQSAASIAAGSLRVSAAAARAGNSLDSLLGVAEPLFADRQASASHVRRSSFPTPPAAAGRNLDEGEDGEGADAQNKHEGPSSRMLSSIDRAQLLLQATEGRGVHVAHRRRAEDLLEAAKDAAAAAKHRAVQGLPPISIVEAPAEPAPAKVPKATQRPGSAATAATADPFPTGLPKTFGMYPRETVDKFRATWMALDRDGSGAVDVEELLNAKIFASSAMKVTKAIFATIDADKSGDVSLSELVKVVFPMGTLEVRSSILRYIRYMNGLEAEEKRRQKEARYGEGSPVSAKSPKAQPAPPPSTAVAAAPSAAQRKLKLDDKVESAIAHAEAQRAAREARRSGPERDLAVTRSQSE
jgi:EF hand